MDKKDQHLGMNRSIDRRDFLNGVGVTIGAALLPATLGNGALAADPSEFYYPPAETGMRGSHPGSFEAAHGAVKGKQWKTQKSDEHYDLVIVGAGISGLSAAYIYRRDIDPKARILILDNHDDFGGHAKRNEFTINGKTLIGFGGTEFIMEPSSYPAVSKQVIRELGIDHDNDDAFNHDDLFKKLGLGRSTFFDKETFGADYLAVGRLNTGDTLKEAPLSAAAKVELKRLLDDKQDYLEGMTTQERREVVESHSWHDYLGKYAGIGEEVLKYIQRRPHATWSIGADALPAWLAWTEGYPGFAGMDIGYKDDDDSEETPNERKGNFRFPDGNASVARLLVRKFIPEVAAGNTIEDVVTAKFDYSKLDLKENQTRIRLSSTVVSLNHMNGDLKAPVDVTYVLNGKGSTVTANKVIWSGYHAMMPHICNDIPQQQSNAMSSSVRSPLVFTNVLIRNWHSFANLGISRVNCPGSFFNSVGPTHPVSIGDYHFAKSPNDPLILHLLHVPLKPGLSAPDQFRQGRRALLETSFDTFERNVRDQLERILGPGGFDPARDIAGITVNRWSHGYAFSVDEKSGDVAWYPDRWEHGHRPWEDARQRFGNIAIAGTDASSNAMTESAIEEAYRAVHSFVE